MVKCCGPRLLEHLEQLFGKVWEEGVVPQDWKDALIVPIPKKGDLSYTDNWRGISLLDVVGKLFAKTIQGRLQTMAEEMLLDSQCGFRRGRGCVDMIFGARQLIEKTIEHNTKMFMLFVDLKKAYDSVPREALWSALESYGIPDSLLKIVRSLHDGMQAQVIVDGRVAPTFEVRNGLRQGYVLAPTLFNLYFNLVIRKWQEKCGQIGVDVLYKCGGKLVGERTRRPDKMTVTELQFADDLAAVSTTRVKVEESASILNSILREWGLTMSMAKTKLLVVGSSEEEGLRPLKLDGGEVEYVTEFRYLGSLVESRGGAVKEVGERIAKASRAFGALRKAVFRDKNLSLETKTCVQGCCVRSVAVWLRNLDDNQSVEQTVGKCFITDV